jgi:anti-sigma B factor antagonist
VSTKGASGDAAGSRGETLRIETKTQDGVSVVKVDGRLSLGPELSRFSATLEDLLKQSQNKIVLDLEEVPTIDSSAIGALVKALTSAKQTGGSVRLLKPTKFILQTLKMVGLLNLFPTYENLSEAIASFQ